MGNHDTPERVGNKCWTLDSGVVEKSVDEKKGLLVQIEEQISLRRTVNMRNCQV